MSRRSEKSKYSSAEIFDILQKPLQRSLFGFFLLVSGIILFSITQYDKEIFGLFCKTELGFWCGAFRVSLFDLGFKGLAYVFVITGAILLVLYDLVTQVFGYILSFALNHVSNASHVVIDAMERGRMTEEESSSIIRATIARFKGYYDERSNSFSDYLTENFIEQNRSDGGFWRGDFRTNIEVRNLHQHELDETKYLRWDETSKFVVWSENKSGTYKYSSATSVEADDLDEALCMIKFINYDVRCDGKPVFSFSDFREKITKEKLEEERIYSNTGLTMKFVDKELILQVALDLPIHKKETDIVVDEESFILTSDTTYEMSFIEPTRGVNLRLSLPDKFEFVHEGVSGERIGTKEISGVSLNKPRINQVRVDSTEWCLPGIWAMLVWKSPNT